MIGLPVVYTIAGVFFALFAVLSATERRWANALFHALLAVSFLGGDRLGDAGNGVLVLVLALVAVGGSGRMRRGRANGSGGGGGGGERPRGNALFVPALLIPLVAVGGTLLFKQVPALIDAKQVTLVALTAGVLLALAVCYAWLRPRPLQPFREGVRLMDDIGWAALLPQALASLGAVFALAGVGDVLGGMVGRAIPAGSLLAAVAAYTIGTAALTALMGNAFAAFPVMTAAVGVPLLVRAHGGDPAPIAAIGMLAGFCGTLATPMAANFNLVPAALLDLPDRYGVIRRQLPTALPLLGFNTILLWWVLR